MKRNYWETHLYTYAVMLTSAPGLIYPETLKAMRAKAIKFGHTEGQCLCVERNPYHFVRHGSLAA